MVGVNNQVDNPQRTVILGILVQPVQLLGKLAQLRGFEVDVVVADQSQMGRFRVRLLRQASIGALWMSVVI